MMSYVVQYQDDRNIGEFWLDCTRQDEKVRAQEIARNLPVEYDHIKKVRIVQRVDTVVE